MLADFKIRYVNNTDDGKQVIAFRFYEGAITTEDEEDPGTGVVVSVTRYRRSAVVTALNVNRDTQLSEADIIALGCVELAKIPDHDPIEEQRVA
jgi:hypothetical protein